MLLTIKRKVYEVEFDGVKYFVRALTQKEAKAVEDAGGKNFAVLLAGLCDVNGLPQLVAEDAEAFDDVPLDLVKVLVAAVLDHSTSKKD